MPNDLSGAELDARFFEVCLPSRMARIGVSTDATCCEAWAMRWCEEQKLSWRIDKHGRNGECRAEVFGSYGLGHLITEHGYGQDWKEAFVRACVAAGQILNQAKGGA